MAAAMGRRRPRLALVAPGMSGHYKTPSDFGASPEASVPRGLRLIADERNGTIGSGGRLGGMSRVAKGADCKSAGVRLRRFESYFPHQQPSGTRRLIREGDSLRGYSTMVVQQPSK